MLLAFLYTVTLLLAESGGAAAGGFMEFYNKYLNYPGFEAWKFINLGIFIAVLVYLVKKPLSDAFKAKREAIRAELIKAEEEKQAALAELTATEAKLASLEMERARILQRAREEIEAEKAHILNQTEVEIAKIREQADGEINRLIQQVKAELRRFSAEESVRRAEERLRAELDPDSDARLVRTSIQEMGGLS